MKKYFSSFIGLVLSTFVFSGIAFAQDFTQPPLEVENVMATAGNAIIDLVWDEATDPDGVVMGYKVYYGTISVQAPEDSYADEVTLGNVTSYSLSNLTNGTRYYLAVTAVDDEGNESETYSLEVSATPQQPGANNPKVLNAEQISNEEVMITMSEEIQLADPLNAFLVEDAGTLEELPIDRISLDRENIFLTFKEGLLVPGKAYRIIATSLVEDLEGNPVASGITDTVEFTAQDITPPEPPAEEPNLNLPEEAESPISPDNYIDEPPVEILPPEEVVLPVDEPVHSAPVEEPPVETDLLPPMDGTGLQIDTSQLESDNIIVLRWTPALDVDNDIADQVLYTRKGLEAWDSGYSLGKDISEVELEVDFDQNYEVRLVTVDASRNESSGAKLSFSTHLSQTGPGEVGTVIALALLFFVGLIFLGKRRAAY